jgi:putative hydrolase of the HAD superfamily
VSSSPGARTPVRAVLFDMGGILEAPFDDVLFTEMARLLGVPEPELRRERSRQGLDLTLGRTTLREFYATVVAGRASGVAPDAAVARHLAVYESATGALDVRVLELIADLRRRRHIVACLTNTEVEVGRFNRDRGLYRAFDRAFLSTEMGLHKPERAVFERAVAELGCAPGEAVFTDDKLENVMGARAAGVHGIHYRDFDSFAEELAGLVGRGGDA